MAGPISGPTAGRSGINLVEATKLAAQHLAELSGRDVVGIVAVERAGELWRVCIEVVELRRIPDSHDLLAQYQAELDADGDLISYRRITRYPRGSTKEGGR
jgi:hypothetical protein